MIEGKFIDANYIPYTPTKWLTYDDVSLIPKFSTLKSRNDPSISLATKLGAYKLNIPIITAPMDTICESKMAIAVNKFGGLGILHRFYKKYGDTAKDIFLDDVKKVFNETGLCAFSIGLHPNDIDLVSDVLKISQHAIVCLDIANAETDSAYHFIKKLSSTYAGKIQIMAGSVCTPNGIQLLINAGAHIIRCGIGGGSLCSTRVVTGHGIPQLSCILHARRVVHALQKNVSIVADGGIRNSGDILKALAAGADAVMCGNLLSGTDESPGNILDKDGINYDNTTKLHRLDRKYKLYRGQSSLQFMQDIGKNDVTAEGESTLVPYKGSVVKILKDLTGGIRSGFTYSGSSNIDEFYNNSTFCEISHHSYIEGTPHLLRSVS